MESLYAMEETAVTKIECSSVHGTKIFELNDSELTRLLDKLFAMAITKAVIESIREDSIRKELHKEVATKH